MGVTGVRQVPELVDIESYCKEIGTTVDPQRFYQYYSMRNWKRNGEPITDWKEVLRQWASTQYSQSKPKGKNSPVKYAIYGEDPEFTAYVDWFNAGGWKEIWRRIAGDNYKEKYEEQTGEKWIGE